MQRAQRVAKIRARPRRNQDSNAEDAEGRAEVAEKMDRARLPGFSATSAPTSATSALESGFRLAKVVLLLALCAALAACARTRVTDPIDTNARPGVLDAEMAYWDEVAKRPAVSNDEALHGLFLFAEGADYSGSWQDRLELARQRGWVPHSFSEDPDLALQHGALARAVAVITRIEGGVMMRLLGPTPRYALRELVWEGIMAGGTANQTITGLEFVGVVSKAHDYMLRNNVPIGTPPETARLR